MERVIYLICLLTIFYSCKQEQKESIEFNKASGNNKVENKNDLFEFLIPDTISLGKHIARISKYKRLLKQEKEYLLTVIVENQYENSEIKKDTFSDGTLNPFFGIYGYKLGHQKIILTVEEKILEENLEGDDLPLIIKNVYYDYTIELIVVDGNYVSELEKDLYMQMDRRIKK